MQHFSLTQFASARRRATVAIAVIALVSMGSFGVANARGKDASAQRPAKAAAQGKLAQDIRSIRQAYRAGDQATMDAAVDQLKKDLDASLAAKKAKTTTTTEAGSTSTTVVGDGESTSTTVVGDGESTSTTVVGDGESTSTTVVGDGESTSTTVVGDGESTSTTVVGDGEVGAIAELSPAS